MQRRLSLLPVLGILALGSAGARAGTLTSATWYQTVQTGIGTAAVIGVPMTRTTAQLGALGTSTATSISVSLSYPAFATTVFADGTAAIDLALQVTQGGPQVITATAAMGNGSPAVPGTLILMSAVHNSMGVNQSMFQVAVNTLVSVPLSHGKEGQLLHTFLVVGAVHFMTVDFYAWTPGTLVFTGLTLKGNALPDVSAMGSFNVTSQGGGVVTLVAPSKLTIDGQILGRRTASFSRLELTFVPEPSTLLLLGGAGVALLGGARRRA
jgi:hypothetical protein